MSEAPVPDDLSREEERVWHLGYSAGRSEGGELRQELNRRMATWQTCVTEGLSIHSDDRPNNERERRIHGLGFYCGRDYLLAELRGILRKSEGGA